MNSFVPRASTRSLEYLLTNLTLVQFAFFVDFHMLHSMSRVDEVLATLLACVRFLVGMSLNMLGQVAQLLEISPTQITGEWSLISVDPNVANDTTWFGKVFPAVFTDECAHNVSMSSHPHWNEQGRNAKSLWGVSMNFCTSV